MSRTPTSTPAATRSLERWWHHVSMFLVLYGTWYLLSGYTKPFFLISGAICALLTVALMARMDVVDHESHPVHLGLRAPLYFAWLIKEIVLSTLTVAKAVWSPLPGLERRLHPGLAWVTASQKSTVARATYANSLTLTPGTVSVDMEGDKILVHALNDRDFDTLAAGEMDARVSRFAD